MLVIQGWGWHVVGLGLMVWGVVVYERTVTRPATPPAVLIADSSHPVLPACRLDTAGGHPVPRLYYLPLKVR